jgi:hypothetical protein
MSTTTTTTTLARFFRIVCARACSRGRLSNQEIRADAGAFVVGFSDPCEKEMASDVAGTIGDQLNENGILYQN